MASGRGENTCEAPDLVYQLTSHGQCVPERLPLKQRVLTELDAVAPEGVIIASNSSSYSCGEIIENLTLKHRSRILSAHTCKLQTGIVGCLDNLTDILQTGRPRHLVRCGAKRTVDDSLTFECQLLKSWVMRRRTLLTSI